MSDEPGKEKCRAEVRIQAQPRKALREYRRFRTHAQIASQREAHASAGCWTVHRSNHRLWHGGDGYTDFLAQLQQHLEIAHRTARARIAKKLHVTAAAESAARASDHHRAHRLIVARPQEPLQQLAAEIRIQ